MKYHILSIGVSKHQIVTPNLNYAHKDAIDFYELFVQNVSNIGSKQLLPDSEATLSGIRTALSSPELQNADADDAFFFFFSGHGTTAKSDGKLSHFLVPFDATGDFASSCISVEYLKESFSKIPCKAQFIFVDSCFSGAVSKGTKYLPGVQFKDVEKVEKFTEVIPGVGNVVLTACKDDETAIELPSFEHGVFTYSVLEQLQEPRDGEKYPIADIFDPVAKAITKHAKDHNHIQTPTISSHFEGSVYLPVFKKPLEVSPQLLETPRLQALNAEEFIPPTLTLDDKKQEKVINELVSLVGKTQNGRTGTAVFSNFCWELVAKLKEEWEKTFQAGRDITYVPTAIAEIEGQAFQLLAMGAVVALYGSDEQVSEYSEAVVSLHDLTHSRAGFTALINVPKIVILLAMYVVGITSVVTRNIKPLTVLLNIRYANPDTGDDPSPLYLYNSVHYSESLGGYATKASDHVSDVIGGYAWLQKLLPKLAGKDMDARLQVNFLLTMQATAHNIQMWPDFARYRAIRILPLTARLKFDEALVAQVAELLDVKPEELRIKLFEYLTTVSKRGLDSYFWESINPINVLTESEKKTLS